MNVAHLHNFPDWNRVAAAEKLSSERSVAATAIGFKVFMYEAKWDSASSKALDWSKALSKVIV